MRIDLAVTTSGPECPSNKSSITKIGEVHEGLFTCRKVAIVFHSELEATVRDYMNDIAVLACASCSLGLVNVDTTDLPAIDLLSIPEVPVSVAA
ncbi:MAG: hypothetical protein ACI9T8_000450 [Candidatus Saccharimonadales bacterium]|jgi:hypothetical protein